MTFDVKYSEALHIDNPQTLNICKGPYMTPFHKVK